ncbi:hypothetical protein F5883DRAFT_385437, partial [Diaporthe sp. PMI_573]
PQPNAHVWYLAYGSNLSSSKFIHDRGITPLSTAVVSIPGWSLSMDSAGVPYSEPSFASILPAHAAGREKSVELIGTAYKLTPEMYKKVLASEGGGIAYAEVEVRAHVLHKVLADDTRRSEAGEGTVAMRSLITVLRREARPSARYMNLLRTGAEEAHMPSSYQKFLASIPVYHRPTRLIPSVGATIFLAIWVPIMSIMEKITKASLKRSRTGNAPLWVITLVRFVVFAMWFSHDYLHAPIWGRGDGME